MYPKCIYHYCKLNTFLEFIMKEKVLRFNSIENSNDPNEYKEINHGFVYDPENYPIGDNMDMLDVGERLNKVIRKTKMICFSTDKNDILSRTVRQGWNLPRMWYSYGDSHRGICIEIINNDLFIQDNLTVLTSPFVFKNLVKYNSKLEYPILKKFKFNSDEEAVEFVIKNREQYFFQKHLDWSGEREFRIISLDKDIEYLHFNLSFGKIILGERCPEIYIPLLKSYFRSNLYKISLDDNREYKLIYV
jgi:hypothetical protein